LAPHICFGSSLARPGQIRSRELQGDVGAPEISLGRTDRRKPPSIWSFPGDEPEIAFAVRCLRSSGADDERGLSTGTAPADIVRPTPDKGGVGVRLWRVRHITQLTIG